MPGPLRRCKDVRRTSYLLATAGFVAGCTPGALHWHDLQPVRDSSVVTAADLYAQADSAARAKAPPNARDVLVLRGDSLVGAIIIYELEDIFWADIWIYNGSSTPYTFRPSQLVLIDGVRTAFRQLRPDEAANLYSARVTAIPPYRPKYTYDVQSSTQGYMSFFGNEAYYNSSTQTTVTPREDPYNALGYGIGSAIARSRNKKFANMAGSLYAVGFVEGSQIPAKTGARGGVYWLKRADWPSPLILRFVMSGREFRFTIPPNQ